MTNVVVAVPADVVFPRLDTSFESFVGIVRGLSRTDVLIWCARLNLVLSNPSGPSPLDVQRWAISRYFTAGEVARLNQFAREHRGAENVVVFSRAQLLELVRWTCLVGEDHSDDGRTFEDPEVRRRFLQAALLASDLWIARTYADGLSVTADRGADRVRAIAPFRHAIRTNYSALELQRGLARGAIIYDQEFARYYPDIDSDFREATGLTLKAYAALHVALLSELCAVTPETADKSPGIFHRDAVGASLLPEPAAAVPHFLALESQTADDLRQRLLPPTGALPSPSSVLDLKALWERPILAAADGRCIVIDPLIFAEKLAVGPLFHLARTHRKDRGRVNRLFAAFGSGFEAYVQRLLCHMWSTTVRNPSRDEGGTPVELADAGVILDDSVVVFEAKGVFVRDDAPNGDAYLEELRGKYVEKPGTGTPKGVGQLARGVRRMITDNFMTVGHDLDAVAHVFPVLVVRDSSMTAPGHVEFLGPAFVAALNPDSVGPDGWMIVDRFQVAPLTIMTIEDLEDLESSVESFAMPAFLHEYTRQGTAGARPSLHDFMASVQNRYRFIHSREVASIAHEKLGQIGRFLYAQASFSADD